VTQFSEVLLQARKSLGHWDSSLTLSVRLQYGPVVDSASNRNEYQGYLLGDKGDRCVGLAALPHLHGDRPEIIICK